MMIVQPLPPVQPGKLPVVVGTAVVLGDGVVVAPGDGVTVAPGGVVAVGNGVAVGTGVVVGTGAAADGVGVGVAAPSLSGPLASAMISRTTPISPSSPSPPERTIGTRHPRGSATSVSAAAPQARHHS